ncbi:MAG TPA: ATP-binding protein [Vicinamibacterales bacterium]|nr:ATP-binding protein [Vicinamibacterales bacterium]
MSVLSSLTNRIFLASALLLVVSIGIAVYRVTDTVSRRAETELRTGLAEAASLVKEYSRTQFADFVVKGRLIADLPVLKNSTATDDPPTVQPNADRYQREVDADLFVVLGRTGRVLARAGRVQPDERAIAEIVDACRRSPDGATFWPYSAGVLHAAMLVLEPGPAPIGTLVIGFSLDQDAARRFKTLTNSEIAFALGPQIVASTLDPERTAELGDLAGQSGVFRRRIGGEDYVGQVEPLGVAGGANEPVALVLRSRTEHLQFLPQLRWQIALTGLAAVLVATLVGYGIARTVTRPLRALTATMREMAATGDLARTVPAVGRWDDEDARLLSTTFGQLTGALDRFQREAAQRERLSSLGRLSTVVAHEIRNPLMIIKSAVRSLRQHPSSDVTEVAANIDEEVQRLNRVVTDVLDFAKPIRFEHAPADLGEICRAAAQAASIGPDAVQVAVEIPAGGISVTTDAERLRAVLVNVLNNAQEAVRARGADRPGGSAIRLRVSRRQPGDWRIEVIDGGLGIPAEDLARLFEPFFTTRRGGSGLGLAIARNIVEGLGGTISVESRVNSGTTVRIDLPETASQPAFT